MMEGYNVRLIKTNFPDPVKLEFHRLPVQARDGRHNDMFRREPGIQGSKELQTLAVNPGDGLRIVGDNDIVLDPFRRPAAFDHLIDLGLDPGPKIAAALGVEEDDRNRVQDGQLHIAKRDAKLFQRAQSADIKDRK